MTITAVYLDIPGKPIPLKRPRFTRSGHVYNAQEKEMLNVRKILRSQYPYAPINEALVVSYCFFMPIPQNWSKKNRVDVKFGVFQHLWRPDVSNLIKFYEDCMNEVIYEDDSLIIKTEAIKILSEEPKTCIILRSALPEEMLLFAQKYKRNGNKIIFS